MEIAFIPRTLYEMILLVECIKEDLIKETVCPTLTNRSKQFGPIEEDCWHIEEQIIFNEQSNDHEKLHHLAFKLNNLIFSAFIEQINNSKQLALEHIFHIAEEKLNYLKLHHQMFQEALESCLLCTKKEKRLRLQTYLNIVHAYQKALISGPSINFASSAKKKEKKVFLVDGFEVPEMGIANDKIAQIIRNAIIIECSPIADHHIFLYRGSDIELDSTQYGFNCYSLSYGTGLFSGSVYDGHASAFTFMQKRSCSYIIPLDYKEQKSLIFALPRSSSLVQFFGSGELFHPRTKLTQPSISILMRAKVTKNVRMATLVGIQNLTTVSVHGIPYLITSLSAENLENEFKKHKMKAIQLT